MKKSMRLLSGVLILFLIISTLMLPDTPAVFADFSTVHSWEGTWFNFPALNIEVKDWARPFTVSGNELRYEGIDGTYSGDWVSVKGIISGNNLVGTIYDYSAQNGGKGSLLKIFEFNFTIQPDGMIARGKYRYQDRDWNNKGTEDAPNMKEFVDWTEKNVLRMSDDQTTFTGVQPSSVAVGASWSGEWETNQLGIINFQPVGSIYKGKSSLESYRFTAQATGTDLLEGVYNKGSAFGLTYHDSGRFQFKRSADGNTITGNYWEIIWDESVSPAIAKLGPPIPITGHRLGYTPAVKNEPINTEKPSTPPATANPGTDTAPKLTPPISIQMPSSTKKLLTAEQIADNPEWANVTSAMIFAPDDPSMLLLYGPEDADSRIINIDGNRGTAPILYNGRMILPIGTVIQILGGSTAWDGGQKKITISVMDTSIEMWLNQSMIRVNGNNKTMDVAPISINGRTMVPLRYMENIPKTHIRWNAKERMVIIGFDEGTAMIHMDGN